MAAYFPPAPHPELLTVTDEGSYSVSKPKDAEQTVAFMEATIPTIDALSITDGTANCGGDSIAMALRGWTLTSIERDAENYAALVGNFKAFDLPNKPINGNTVAHFNKHPTNVLFLDPPWGGTDYKTIDKLDIFFGPYFVEDYVGGQFQKHPTLHHVVLKLPYNYPVAKLKALATTHKLTLATQKVRNYFVYILSRNKSKGGRKTRRKTRSKSRGRTLIH